MAENAWSALHPVRAALCRAEGNWLLVQPDRPVHGRDGSRKLPSFPIRLPCQQPGRLYPPDVHPEPSRQRHSARQVGGAVQPQPLYPDRRAASNSAPAGYGDHFGIGHPSSSVCQLRCYTVHSAGSGVC